jgi:hypothetical protein
MGEVSEHEPEPISHPRLYVFDDRVRHAAVRAFVIPVLNERDRRIRDALRVITRLVHRHGENCGPLCLAHVSSPCPFNPSSAPRMPSAPGFSPTGET